jgi:hypothetical protein
VSNRRTPYCALLKKKLRIHEDKRKAEEGYSYRCTEDIHISKELFAEGFNLSCK